MLDNKLDESFGGHLATMAQRTERALAASGFDALVIHAGAPPTQFLDDQDYPFKVNPHFKSWIPIVDNPHCVVIIRPAAKPQLLFHSPKDFWHKAAPTPQAAWTAAVDLIEIHDARDALAHYKDLKGAAYIGPPECFPDIAPQSINPADLVTRLHYDRAVKTPYELDCMRRASRLGARGHRAAFAAFRRGASEYTAHMQYLEACQQREEEMPYNNIIAYNENSAVLHYQHLEREPPSQLRSFLIDAGAQYRGYASDITRTYAATAGRFADLIAATDAAQQSLCGEIIAGRDFREVHLTAHRVLGGVLRELDIIDVDADAALELGLTSVFFPHGIGHLLGLQVHDVGGVLGSPGGGERQRPEGHPYLRLTRLLEPGVVVTVEPGLYFIDSLLAKAHAGKPREHIKWNVVEELKPYGGIRIEDNIATTAAAPENLTRDAFAAIAA